MKNQKKNNYENLSDLTSLEWLDEEKLEEEIESKVNRIEISDTFLSWLDIDNTTLELLDTETKEKVKKKRIILWLLIGMLIIGTIFGLCRQVTVYRRTVLAYEQDDKPALQWVKSFVETDFVTCDTLVKQEETKLTTTQNDYYVEMLTKAVKGITNISIKKIVDKGDKICYDIIITYKTYESKSDFSDYATKYKELEELYLKDEITEEQLREELKTLYNISYKNAYILTDNEQKKEFSIYSDENGVYNVDILVKSLIEGTQVLYVNNEIKEKMSEIRKEY